MKLFLLEANEMTVPPRILNWYDKVAPGPMTPEKFHKLSRFTNIRVETLSGTKFPDMVSYPRFMVTNKFTELLRAYEPSVVVKYIIMIDKQNKRSQMYAMPEIPTITCLSDQSELSINRSTVKNIVIKEEKVKGRKLFQIGDVTSQYVVAELHLVESLLRREMTGLSIQEIPLCREGE